MIAEAVSRIKDLTVKQIIEQWNQDLESHVRSFMEQAREVRKWDEQVLDTSAKVPSRLYLHVVVPVFTRLYSSLSFALSNGKLT